MNDSNGQKRSDVLNDDVLSLILGRLDIKDLFALQRVSQQFRDCHREVLLKKRVLSIGFNKQDDWLQHFKSLFKITNWKRLDITSVLFHKGANLVNRNEWRLESMVDHFRDVNSLYLSSTRLNAETIKLLVNHWPHLRKLYIHNIDINVWTDQMVADQWAQLMSKFTHITTVEINIKYEPFITSVIKKLPLLQSLRICTLYAQPFVAFTPLAKCLPENIQSLDIHLDTSDTQAIHDITSRYTQLRQLFIHEHRVSSIQIDPFNEWFALICGRLQRLKRLDITLNDISAKDFADSIVKLKELRHLNLYSCPLEQKQSMCFDTQAMAAHMKPMQSLRLLLLYGMRCSPNRWSNMAEMFPNVRQLSIPSMYWHIDCHNQSNCNQCFHQCMDCVSKLPQLKHMIIKNRTIHRQTLDLFAGVDRLSLKLWSSELKYDDVISFLTSEPVAKRGRVFHLELSSIGFKDLMERMREMNVQMPDNVIVSEKYFLF